MSDPIAPSPQDLDDDAGFSDLYDMAKAVDQRKVENGGVSGDAPAAKFPALEAGTRSAIEGLGATGGLAAGVAMGMPYVATPVIGPAIPIATGLAGMAAGAYSTSRAAEAAGLRSSQQMPPEQRPQAVFGENIGAGVGMLVPVYGAALRGLRFTEQAVGGYLNSIIETAKRMPIRFGVVEGTSSISAGVGGAAAESADPGNAMLRAGSEVVMGYANPVWRLNQLVSVGTNTARSIQSKFGSASQQDLVAKQILGLMAQAGEDPATVIRVLKQQMPKEFDAALTAGQKSGSDTLIGFERGLYEHSGKFGNDAREKAVAAMDMISVQIGLLAMSGKPEHLAEIAKLRQARYETLIADKLEKASTDVALSVAKVSKGGKPEDKGVLSTNAKIVLGQVEDEINVVANDLWGKVNRNVDVPLTNVQAARQELLDSSAKYLKGEKVPSYLENAIRDAEKRAGGGDFDYDPVTFAVRDTPDGPVTLSSKELLDYRRKLGSAAREAVRAGDDYAARNLFKLEEAILKDLDTVFRKTGDTAYDEARGFTKAYHDVFERSFVGSVSAVSKTGDRIPPAMLLDRALSGGAVAADIKLRDLERGSQFLEVRGMGTPGAVETMLDTQEQFYRIVTAASIGKDGRVDPNKVRGYIEKNAVLLNRAPFNEIKKDLLDTIKSEEGLRRLENLAKMRNGDIGRNSAFAQIVKSDPLTYASRVLLDKGDQEKQLVSMFNMARKGAKNITPEEGIRSARAALIASAVEQSMRGTGLDIDSARGLLFTPNIPGKKPVIQIMQEQGVVDANHVKNMRVMFDYLDNINKAKRLGQAITIEAGSAEIGILLAAKIGASRVTSAVQGFTGSSGAELTVHGAVAKAVEHVVAKMPKAKTKDMAVLLFNDPKMLATVLERNTRPNAATQMAKVRQLKAWMLYSGLITPGLEYNQRADYERPPEAPQMFSLPQ